MHDLIDTHAHLHDIDDLDTALAAAREAGVTGIIAVGIDLPSNRRTLDIAERYPGFVFPALGYYPGNLREPEIEENLQFLRDNIARAVAVGEVGIDYSKWVRAGASKELQKQVLREILKIAVEYDKPALIHSRYAWRDAFNMAASAGVKKAVFHWYTGPESTLKDILAQGYYISATPAVAYHPDHRQAVKNTPLSQLLLETDCPVVYARGREGEFKSAPSDVVRALKSTASGRRENESDIAEATTLNAKRLFRIK